MCSRWHSDHTWKKQVLTSRSQVDGELSYSCSWEFFAQLCDFAWVLPWTLLHSALMFLWLLDNFETSPVTCPLFGTCLVTAEWKKELSLCGEECVVLYSLVLALELLRVWLLLMELPPFWQVFQVTWESNWYDLSVLEFVNRDKKTSHSLENSSVVLLCGEHCADQGQDLGSHQRGFPWVCQLGTPYSCDFLCWLLMCLKIVLVSYQGVS